MERELLVHVDRGRPVLVGRLWCRERTGRETSTFTYDPGWLARRDAFPLAPSIPMGPGPQHASGLPSGLSDAAPDAWGRLLILRHGLARATRAGGRARTLLEIDFLAAVDDRTRLGALRFADPETGDFVAAGDRPIPPIVSLPRLLAAAGRVSRDRETEEDLLLLLAPGTSLGGARPKATVQDVRGSLAVAKFPKPGDAWPVTTWEAVILALAGRAGVSVPQWSLESVGTRRVLLLGRFDRSDSGIRIPFLSGMSAVDAKDHEPGRSYLELLDFLRAEGSRPAADAHELWRRIVLNVLVSNTDDHLRNHAFLRENGGWRLSPAFDMNPCPPDVRPRVHALAIDETDSAASFELALSVAPRFGIAQPDARAIGREVARAVGLWRAEARKLGLAATHVERMAAAFEHDDLARAAGVSPRRGHGRPC